MGQDSGHVVAIVMRNKRWLLRGENRPCSFASCRPPSATIPPCSPGEVAAIVVENWGQFFIGLLFLRPLFCLFFLAFLVVHFCHCFHLGFQLGVCSLGHVFRLPRCNRI